MDQTEYWNGEAGAIWAGHVDVLDGMLAPLGLFAMDALAPRPGERILDIGCGAGSTSRALAARVGPGGFVLGVDVSGPLLEVARARGGGPTYHHGDAGAGDLPGAPFDGAFSRFGVMFFHDPPAAFANLRAALRPGGRLAFICWRALVDNSWARDPLSVALPLLKEPPAPMPPDAPGPFAFADDKRLRGILESAGWSAVSIAPHDAPYLLGATVEVAVSTSLRIGPLSRLMREQGLDPAPVREALEALYRRHLDERGVVTGAACWIVTATS